MANDFTICVGTVGAGVWFSPDGGDQSRRSKMKLPFYAEPAELQVRTLAVSPHNPHHLLAGSARRGSPVDESNNATKEERVMISKLSMSKSFTPHPLRQSALFAIVGTAFAFLAAYPAGLHAQDAGSSMPQTDAGSSTAQTAQQAAGALTGDQQSAANKALCGAIGSQLPNPTAAAPSDLSSSAVISAAASTFAGSTNLPLPSATSMLQGYVAQHATHILASCAVSNATSGVTSKIPGTSSLPSIP